ncbi:hypothetical protein DER46DRAFT_70420 [Fusarium sp. MPI-SDFR-AT-0072]|nr:hypothetical protein DER46DRAFT_70420 [Fusarium sp. MPI-SDFR-AT-0072]
MVLFPSRQGTEMSNQINEMEYSFDDGVKPDIDIPDAGASSVLDGACPFPWCRDRQCQGRRINVAPSERHVDHAETSPNSEHPFATMIRHLVTAENEVCVQEVLDFLGGKKVLDDLRIVSSSLKLGENGTRLNDRRFRDREGNDLMCISAEHREALDLLCDVHGFQNSNEPVLAIIYLQEYNRAHCHLHRALYHWHRAECLSRRWLAQRYRRSPSNMEQMWS